MATATRADRTGDQVSPFGRMILITGPEELLAQRAAGAAIDRARHEDPAAELSDLDAVTLEPGRLTEVAGASLFASRRVLVLRGLADLPSDLADQVLALATAEDPDLALIAIHGGGQKGKGLVDKLKKSGAHVVDCAAVKPWEMAQFVSAEFRREGARVDSETSQFLVDAIGPDLRALTAAVRQLIADADDAPVTTELARRYFGGRGEVTGFAVADAVLAGRTTTALEQLRWALGTGVPPVLLTSALAGGLRGLGRFVSAGGGQRDVDLAREIGVPVWKLKTLRGQARGWDQQRLAAAIAVVARADADVKGLADDAAHALERAVLDIERARRR